MRNSYIVNIILAALTGLAACKGKPSGGGHAGHEAVADSSVAALTGPVNSRVIATIPDISPESGTRIYATDVSGVITYDTRNQTSIASRVGGRIEKLLVRYNYQPVKKGQLIMEVYSPDLAAAQRELLYVAASSTEMLAAARQRLQLLGMQPSQITQVLKTGNIMYRIPVYSNSDGYILEKTAAAATTASPTMAPAAAPSGDGMGGMEGSGSTGQQTPAAPAASPVLLREGQYVNAGQSLFTIYQASDLVAEFSFPPQLAARIQRGQKLLFAPVNTPDDLQAGNIGLIEPVFRNGQNFTLARVYLGTHQFRTGQLLTASIPLVYKEGWWLPKAAVWRSGNRAVVFRKEQGAYVPVEVATKAVTNDMIQVMTDIGGWKVASNAAYLVDSESFIKTNH